MADGQQFNIIAQKSFRQSLKASDIAILVSKQLNNLVPDPFPVDPKSLEGLVAQSLDRVKNCFRWINNKYYTNDQEVLFDHLQSDHYCAFIYLLSNTAYKAGETAMATKLFLINKYLHGLDLYFSVELPEVFMLVHPVGSVIGNASYGNFFVAYQNCTIGSTVKNGKYIYPVFGENVTMYARSVVIGNCEVGSNVVIGANSFILNSKIPSNSIVTGVYPELVVNQKEKIASPFFFR